MLNKNLVIIGNEEWYFYLAKIEIKFLENNYVEVYCMRHQMEKFDRIINIIEGIGYAYVVKKEYDVPAIQKDGTERGFTNRFQIELIKKHWR